MTLASLLPPCACCARCDVRPCVRVAHMRGKGWSWHCGTGGARITCDGTKKHRKEKSADEHEENHEEDFDCVCALNVLACIDATACASVQVRASMRGWGVRFADTPPDSHRGREGGGAGAPAKERNPIYLSTPLAHAHAHTYTRTHQGMTITRVHEGPNKPTQRSKRMLCTCVPLE